MARPSKKLEQYISLNEKIKKLTKQKDEIRSQLVGDKFPMDIIGVDHYATIKLKNRYVCNLSLLQDKHPNAWTKYYEEEIIKNVIFPTIIYKRKVSKAA